MYCTFTLLTISLFGYAFERVKMPIIGMKIINVFGYVKTFF